MYEKIKEILDFDPLETAEKSNNERYEEIDVKADLVDLGLIMMASQAKREYFEKTNDTFHGIKWKKFIEIAKREGFRCGICQKFTRKEWWYEEAVEEEEIIFFHEEKGVILHAESLDGDGVNFAEIFGEVKINGGLTEKQRDALKYCPHGFDNGNGTMYFNVDVREGFCFCLDTISEAFDFSKNWTTIPRNLNLINSQEGKKNKCKNYKEISRKKIKACSPEVRKIMFG